MSIADHIEEYLGTIIRGWGSDDPQAAFHVVKTNHPSAPAANVYSTLGMSNFLLSMPRQRTVRQELIFTAYDHYCDDGLAAFLFTFAHDVIAKGRALLRGEAFGPNSPLLPGAPLKSIYCTAPVLFDERLATCSSTEPNTVFVWLVPITEEELAFVRHSGWSAFEDRLERFSPNFCDLARPSIPL